MTDAPEIVKALVERLKYRRSRCDNRRWTQKDGLNSRRCREKQRLKLILSLALALAVGGCGESADRRSAIDRQILFEKVMREELKPVPCCTVYMADTVYRSIPDTTMLKLGMVWFDTSDIAYKAYNAMIESARRHR